MFDSDDDSHGFQPDEADADLEAKLDRDFPLGDGMAETSATVVCPYCREVVAVTLDPGSGSAQEYVEDCEVCCQPWSVSVSYRDGHADVSVRPLDA
jgi:Cysteine-rich CPXCG